MRKGTRWRLSRFEAFASFALSNVLRAARAKKISLPHCLIVKFLSIPRAR